MAKILVVDDDAFNRDLLQQELGDDGHLVETAVDGEDALAKVAQFLPDVILLDQMMPRLDGIEVVKRLKADDRLRAIPVIMVTGRGAQDDKVRGLEAGASWEYLTDGGAHWLPGSTTLLHMIGDKIGALLAGFRIK